MIYGIYPLSDATIYEASESTTPGLSNPSIINTGLDAVLDISKTFDGAENPYNSRALLKFDLAAISQSISAGQVTNPKFYLSLYTTEAEEIPVNYTLYAYAVSQSWNMGTGRYVNTPPTTDGVSWKFRLNSTNTGSAWLTASFAAGSTGSFASNGGGGTWYTAYQATQSFSYQTTDVRMDVTNIVRAWLSSSVVNDGFIVKKSDIDEASDNTFLSLKFFSRDTNTIYSPKLEVAWDDSTIVTGSLAPLSDIYSSVVYIKNNQAEYVKDSRVRFRINARPQYPTRSFVTESAYVTTNNHLPTSSYYGVKYLDKEDYVIPIDENYTKISCDSAGNYIDLWMDGLQPEVYYRFVFKLEDSTGTLYIDKKRDFIFKITR